MSRIILAGILFLYGSAIVHAEHRAALLIGNSDYPKAALASPANDIRAVGEALTKRGFVVTTIENATGEQMRTAVEEFSKSIPTRGTALIYFSGYALAASKPDDPNAENMLLPIDGRAQHTGTVASARTGTVRMFGQLAKDSGSAANFLLVDGCYEHPEQLKESPRGLIASGEVPAESRILYAAPFGEVMQPAQEGLSPLAQKFSAELKSQKPLQEILANLTETQESTLESIDFLAEPASTRVDSAAALAPGKQAGDEWVSDIGMVFCWCPPGKFSIGSPESSPHREADESQVQVEFDHGFWMAKYEFTRRELFAMTGRGIYLSTGGHKLYPLNKMRADDPAKLLAILNETAPEGWTYDLPTEAEWEYAARAGTDTEYSFGNNPADLQYHGNFADRTLRESNSYGEVSKNWKADAKPFAGDRQTGLFTYAHKTWDDHHETMAWVGSFPANAWGLHDVHGNMAELTITPYHAERTPPEKFDDRLGWVSKGGSWLSTAQYCRSAFRGQFTFRARENSTENFLGLRFILRSKEQP